MTDPDARLHELVHNLRDRSHRLTPQQVAVLGILSTGEGHPSVQQIYDMYTKANREISSA